MDAVPPSPGVKKGDPAGANLGTNVARAATHGNHVEPAACGWACKGVSRLRCQGFTRIGALR